jgi:hypothetical protein
MNHVHSHAAAQGNCDRDRGLVAAQRELEVPGELGELLRNVTGIRQGLDTLEDRLGESIMRPRQPEPTGAGLAAAPAASPSCTNLGSQVREANVQLRALSERVQSVIARLEA